MPVEALYSFSFTLAGPVITHFIIVILATYVSSPSLLLTRSAFPYMASLLADFIIEGPGTL